jgi:hypothetical protein
MTTVAVLLSAVLAAGAARAQTRAPSKNDVAEAHRRFQRATELYEENNLAGALAEFRRAYGLAPNYKVLYNIGQLCFLLQDYPCAFTSLSRYLGEGGSDVPADRREEVQRDVTRLQTRVAKLRIIADRPGAEVTVDEVAVGRTPLPEPVLVAAGRPRVQVTLAGYAPVSRVVEVAGMETSSVDIELIPEAEAATGRAALSTAGVARSAPSVSVPKAPWVVTGILAAGAGVTGALALWSSSDLKARRGELTSTADDLSQRSTRTKQLALATDILLGTTVVAAGIATYLTVTRPSAETVALVVAPDGARLVLNGAF